MYFVLEVNMLILDILTHKYHILERIRTNPNTNTKGIQKFKYPGQLIINQLVSCLQSQLLIKHHKTYVNRHGKRFIYIESQHLIMDVLFEKCH